MNCESFVLFFFFFLFCQEQYCDNTYSLGKYSPNSKNYCPESGTPTSKRGRAKEERGTEKLSTYALPSEGNVPLEVQYFFDEGLYSK